MIEAKGLTKRYGATVAVDDLSFTVPPGQVTGFLGPNGAGKSTTMRMILGLDAPTPGRSRSAAGRTRPAGARCSQVGALLEAKAFHGGRTARNHLLCLALSNGISRARVDEVLDLVGLPQRGAPAGRRVLPRHVPAARHRRRAAGRPAGRDVRRAGQRPRPRGRAVDPHPAQDAGRRGPHRAAVQPPDERDGDDRRPAGHHRPRPPDRPDHDRGLPRRRVRQFGDGPLTPGPANSPRC